MRKVAKRAKKGDHVCMVGQPTYAGAQLRKSRMIRGLSQAQAAAALGLSPSYYNQLEHDRRPLTAAVLDRVSDALGVDPATLTNEAGGRLLAQVRDAFAGAADPTIGVADLRDLVRTQPHLAAAIVELSSRLNATTDRLAELAGEPTVLESRSSQSHEDVRDFFYRRRNHVAELEVAAEECTAHWGLHRATLDKDITKVLAAKFGVVLKVAAPAERLRRRYEPATRQLFLPSALPQPRRAFQLATQLALLDQSRLLDRLVAADRSLPKTARGLARIGLANYFAGAMLLPYTEFLAAAERARYDAEVLCAIFDVGFETICHRLSTLQRPGAEGVPFFYVRTDRAGNISKRQSATNFHFSRTGGSCPLWIVHEAFDTIGRIRRQVARMPDGRTYLWVTRTITRPGEGFRKPGAQFAIGLGCDVRHAGRLVYADGLDLDNPDAATPIGPGCRVCERTDCAQRAFPMIGRAPQTDPNTARNTPYQ